jgi:hypothetical protein
MDRNRKAWNDRHKELRHALEKQVDRKAAVDLFLIQHAMVHSSRLSKLRVYSFEDEILDDLIPDSWRYIPPKGNHSIAWIIWHLARIEDVTMNLLVADEQQVLHKNGWCERLQIEAAHTGNGMSDKEVLALTHEINTRALRQYRLEVARSTRRTVKAIKAEEFGQKVESSRAQRTWDEHAMLPKGKRVVDYWASRTIAGLLLMPPTRHCFLHLNEARRIKQKAMRLRGTPINQ